jgi:16S rRNA (cytosine1402-N4)-methyltransferase
VLGTLVRVAMREKRMGTVKLHHEPVLRDPAVEFWASPNAKRVVDGTVGRAGHALSLLNARPDVELVGLDRDPEAVDACARRFAGFGARARVFHASYDDLANVLHSVGWPSADGILLDLGVSSPQLDDPERGFSTRTEGPLDLRFDPTSGEPASAWLAHAPVAAIESALATLGEEPNARRVARAIDRARAVAPITTTGQLAAAVEGAAGRPGEPRPKALARIFQALRLVVNDELGALDRFLASLRGLLAVGGRVAILSFHSLEDRRVKEAFAAASRDCNCPPEIPACVCGGGRAWLRTLTRRPVVADDAEIARNPRSRSARLRAAERIIARDEGAVS